jgi:hypothetical protein
MAHEKGNAMKPGRNDPCPCGSGKKYKQCCLKAEQAKAGEDDLQWRRIRRTIEGLTEELLKFSIAHFGHDAIHEAWEDFMGEEEATFDPESPHMPVFVPWFNYDWVPAPLETSVPKEAQDGLSLGAAYLRRKGKNLDPLLARYLEQFCKAPYSFFDILSVRSGDGFAVRDIFTGDETYVTEHSGSRQAKAGDILFAKVAKVDSVTLMDGCAPVLFPPIEKGAILELRKIIYARELPLTPELLKEYNFEMLDKYLGIAERLLNPRMPEMRNTDGDPLQFNRLEYEIESPQAAFDALKHLNITSSEANMLAEAERDASGALRKIEFPWQKHGNETNKSWSNTILGNIVIEGGKLTVEVNSENRVKLIRSIIEKALPEARYKIAVIQSTQAMLARMNQEGGAARSKQTEDLNALPEVQAHLAEMMREHYRNWLHEKIPALNGETPLQAVKTPDGREMVEALLLQIERYGENSKQPLDPAILAELRTALGLA